ncbi:MAG: helix-turn-helix transcriptional regulator [Reyranellaceae bacterium]
MSIDLVSLKDLEAQGVRLSAATIWRKVRNGSFPRPVRVSAGRVAWVKSEIEAWKRGLVEARDAQTPAA